MRFEETKKFSGAIKTDTIILLSKLEYYATHLNKVWLLQLNNWTAKVGKWSILCLYTVEKGYSVKELELLGVIWAIDKFKYYFYGQKFNRPKR